MNNIVPGSFQLMKKINTGLILDTIRINEPISRAEIAKVLKLTPATVTNITADLIKQDVIVEGDLGDSSGGRKPILLRINTDAYYIVAVHIMSNRIRIAVLNMQSGIIDCKLHNINYGEDYEKIEADIGNDIENILEKNNILKTKILGIGLGSNGIVDYKHGEIICVTNKEMKTFKLRQLLEREFDVPVYVDKEVSAMAIGEGWYGKGKQSRMFVCINVGREISAAIIQNKQQIRGIQDGYSEFGHIIINSDSANSKKACLESFASENAIFEYCKENSYKGELSIDRLNEELKNGNKIVIEAYEKAGMYLGVGIINLINFYAPPLIIIGGDILKGNDIYFKSMIKYIKENSLQKLYDSISIIKSELGEDVILKGLSALVLDNLFDSIQ